MRTIVASGALLLAAAHPLGNFSVNRAHALRVLPDRIEDVAVVDFAELPTLQNGALTADQGCAAVVRRTSIRVGGAALAWRIVRSELGTAPGAAGLPTSRLSCLLAADHRLSG